MLDCEEVKVLNTFKIVLREEQVIVQVIRMHRVDTQYFYLIEFSRKQILLRRGSLNTSFWCGSNLTLLESEELGRAIENQTKYRLPLYKAY